MTDWHDLLNNAGVSIDEIKERLPLEWVVAEFGVVLERQQDGRLVGTCPFHLDSSPSFAIFGESLDRVGCWSCDFTNGDVLDFIQRAHALEFRPALREAIRLMREYEQVEARGEWQPSPPPPANPVPFETLASAARDAWSMAQTDVSPIRGVLSAKGIDVPARWLHEKFHVGAVDRETILMPHLAFVDDRWQVTAYKTRTPASHPFAASGSKFMDLYGAWRDKGSGQVIICEGESDTWVVAYAFPEADVFGLPAGANQAPKSEWIQRFDGREVTLLFDGDEPGRRAARKWHEATVGIASSVRVASLEDGADACSTTQSLHAVVRQAQEVPPWTGTVITDRTNYVRSASGAPICNWQLRLERLIEMDEGGSAFEGVLLGSTDRVVLTADDLSSESAARRWSMEHDRSWLGSTKDAQALWELMLREGPFLAHGRGSYVAGWHDSHVVLPNPPGSIGPKHWVYVPPVTSPGVDRMVGPVESFDATAAQRQFLSALSLHQPPIVSPMVAWMSVAPLRSLFNVFPPLAVVGGSGAGKTTLVAELLRLFGWSGEEHNLTSSTPYGVTVMAGATNGIPTWFDEYRRGCRPDTKETFEQVLRDAWTGSASIRGGIRSNASSLVSNRALAPLIVSGEDTFSETSHAERLVIVNVPRSGKNSSALEYMRTHQRGGFGMAYLNWLVGRAQIGQLPKATVPDLDRPAQARAILEYGWSLLEQFVGETLGVQLPELDLSAVEAERESALAVPPILDAVQWGLNEADRSQKPLAWVEGDDVIVRVRHLVREAGNYITLPGGERAVQSWLRQEFDGAKNERTNFGMAMRLPGARAVIERIGLS